MAQQRTLLDLLTGRAIFNAVADGYRRLRSRLAAMPSFAAYENLAAKVTSRVFGIIRLPVAFERRVEPILEAALCRKMDPVVVFPILALVAYLGIYPSSLGHLDTTPLIFTLLPFVSTFNPFLGFTSAVVFSAFDWIGKWLPFESVYGATMAAGWQNYFGARLGYIFAYSTVVLMGTLPGVLSRVLRRLAALLTAALLKTPGAQAAAGIVLLAGSGGLVWALNPSPAYSLMLAFAVMTTLQGGVPNPSWPLRLLEFLAGGVGGTIGAIASGSWATNVGNQAAFISFRETPDISCRALSTSNYNNQVPYSATAGGVGGVSPGGIGNAVTPPEPPSIKLPNMERGGSPPPEDPPADRDADGGRPADDSGEGDPEVPSDDSGEPETPEPEPQEDEKPRTPMESRIPTATTGGPVPENFVPPEQQQGATPPEQDAGPRVIGRCRDCGLKLFETVTVCPRCEAGKLGADDPVPFRMDPPAPGDNPPPPASNPGSEDSEAPDDGDPEEPSSDDGAPPTDDQEQPAVDQVPDEQVPEEPPADDQTQDDQSGDGGDQPQDDAGDPPEEEDDEEKEPEKKDEGSAAQPPVTPVTPPTDDAARAATPTSPVTPTAPPEPDTDPQDDAGAEDGSGDPDAGGDGVNEPHQERVDGGAALKILTDLGLADKHIDADGRIIYTIKDNVPGPNPDEGDPLWGAMPTNPGATIVTEEILDATGQNVLERAETPITGISGMSGLDQRVFIVGPNDPEPRVSITVDLGAQRPFEAVGNAPSLGVGDIAAAAASGPGSTHLDSSRVGGGPNVPTVDPTPRPAPTSIADAFLTPSQQLDALNKLRELHNAGWVNDSQLEWISGLLGQSKEDVEFAVKDADPDVLNILNSFRGL